MSAPHRVWRAPVLLAVVTVVGLVAGLLGDGWWDGLAALALAVPLGVVMWHAWPRR